MNGKTAKYLNRAASKMGVKKRVLKGAWKALPWKKRRKLRAEIDAYVMDLPRS
jgi:hypothetical protein